MELAVNKTITQPVGVSCPVNKTITQPDKEVTTNADQVRTGIHDPGLTMMYALFNPSQRSKRQRDMEEVGDMGGGKDSSGGASTWEGKGRELG